MEKRKNDIDLAVKQNKKIKSLKELFYKDAEAVEIEGFVENLKLNYGNEYPEEVYAEYSDVKEVVGYDKKGNLVTSLEYIYTDDNYLKPVVNDNPALMNDIEKVEDTEEDQSELLKEVKELTEEAKALISAGKIRPTLDTYIKWNLNGKEELDIKPFEPTCEDCEAKFVTFVKPILEERLGKIADTKEEQAEAIIADKKQISLRQIGRYKTKLDLAKKAIADKNYSAFELEAKLNGMKAEDLANLIVTKAEAWENELNKFILLIEAYRVKANRVIETATGLNQIYVIEKLLNVAETMGKDIDADHITQLFAEYAEA